MRITEFFRGRAGGWFVALGFVVLWYALLQGVAIAFFNVSPDIRSVPRDLAANLLLAAFLYSISRNLRIYLAASGLLLAALHLSNAGKVAVLGGPIMPDDFVAVRNLFLLLSGWQLVVALLIVATPVWLLVLLPAWRTRRTWLMLGSAGAMLGMVALVPGTVVTAMDTHIGNSVWDQRGNYERRGLLLHLVQEGARYTARASSPPSADEVGVALDRLAGQSRPALSGDVFPVSNGRSRNVHFIVLESFWDPMDLTEAGFSADPVDPRFRDLWRAAGYSRAMSPVFGGYTANAEFEVLCGFPVTEDAVFFEGWLRRDVPCLPRHLNAAGYQTVASHPNVAAFWNRVNAYQRIGFNTYWSESDFVLDDMNGEFLSDVSLYRQVLRKIAPMLAADQPVFNYVLTIFGHLHYPLNEQRPTAVGSGGGSDLVGSYANTIYYKSRELMDFLVQLSQKDPDGIVVLFGDHLPFLGPNFSGFTDSGLLADNRAKFDAAMVRRLVSTPLVVIDGTRGPLRLGDLPMYLIPGLVLDLLNDHRPSVMRLVDAGLDGIVRPLPGMHLLLQGDDESLCRPGPELTKACADSRAWLASIDTLTRDLFGGEQQLLKSLEPDVVGVRTAQNESGADPADPGLDSGCASTMSPLVGAAYPCDTVISAAGQ